jgi:hypothetical protein
MKGFVVVVVVIICQVICEGKVGKRKQTRASNLEKLSGERKQTMA